MNLESVKVNFMISQTSKDNIDEIRKSRKITNSAIVDKLLQFDDEAAELFVSLYKEKNSDRIKGFNVLSLVESGGIVFEQETMHKINNTNIMNMSHENARKLGLISIGFENEFSPAKMNDFDRNKNMNERIEMLEKVVLILNQKIIQLEKTTKVG